MNASTSESQVSEQEKRYTNHSVEDFASAHENDGPQFLESSEPVRRVNTNASVTRADEQDDVISRAFSRTSSFKNPLPVMGGNKPYPPEVPGFDDRYKVEFDGPDDPLNPLNWSNKRKLKLGAAIVYPTVVVVWGSSVYAPVAEVLMAKYDIGIAVAVLSVSLYVLGFATGPVIWGPMSEIYGRRMPMIISCLVFMCFNFWTATADHLYQLMLYRFFAAVFGSAPLAVSAAAFADILTTEARGMGMSIFSLCVIAGPMIAPVVGAYITASYLGYRWTMYITGIMSALSLITTVLFMEESFHPMVLAGKARELRERTGNHAIYAAHERVKPDFRTIAQKVLMLPIIMLFREPILLLMSIYHGFIYGILYLCLEGVPIIFTTYGWKGGNIMLPYLAMFLGATIAIVLNIFYFDPLFAKRLHASGKAVLPEERLPLMVVGGVAFPIGIFMLCWTGHYLVMWMAPVVGTAIIGFGLIAIFLPVFNYIIDTYLFLAASAMAANTFLRSGMGAAFPIFATAMFKNLGSQWAGTLLGCLGLALLPVPVLFYFYGARIRRGSKFAPDLDALMAAKAAGQKQEPAESETSASR